MTLIERAGRAQSPTVTMRMHANLAALREQECRLVAEIEERRIHLQETRRTIRHLQRMEETR